MRCFPGACSGDAGAKTVGAVRPVRATLVGLGLAVVGGMALLLAVLVARNSLLPFFVTASIFLFGLGFASPLSSAAALSPFGDKAGAAAALFGFSQMSGAACGAWLAVVLDSDPAVGLGAVLALTSLLALVLHGWKRQLKQSRLQL